MIREITAKSILLKHKKIDSWFASSYGINLYRGCTHNCVYCDGRSEKYQVEGEFGRDCTIKTNAIALLDKELNPERKRSPFRNGFFTVCGGVSDSYQPFEKTRELCRQTLELLYKYRHPVHMLTKSTLIERDIDLLQKINRQNKALVSFSFSSVDDEISRLLEPGVPPPSERLKTLRRIKAAGISCGMYLMPVVPFLTDSCEMIDNSVAQAKNAGVDFIVFGGMTLKAGRQKEHFMSFIKRYFPEYVTRYENLYSADTLWGSPEATYAFSIEKLFESIATKYSVPKRIPSPIFTPLVSRKELLLLILEQLDYLVKMKNINSPYGYAAYTLSNVITPIETFSYEELLRLKGIGPFTAQLILEILTTGKCTYYEKML
jgi:DNA repair photolyase